MALVQVIKKSFSNEETGRVVDYERLAIVGTIDGTQHTLEIKLSSAELGLAKVLLNSHEDLRAVPTNEHGEVVPVRNGNKKKSDFLDDLELN